MKSAIKHLSIAAALFSVFDTFAASSLLRINCDVGDIGAEISINGVFKGECPLDIQVAAGTFELKVQKSVDATHERAYEQEIRIGDGVAKKVDAVLSVRLNAAGKRLEEEARRVALEKQAQREESDLWRKAQRALDTATIEAYVKRFPAGPRAAEAHAKLAAIRAVEPTKPTNKYARGMLGVEFRDLTDEQADYFIQRELTGILIKAVLKNSPAEKAGILANDVLTGWNETSVTTIPELQRTILAMAPGSQILLQLWRKGGPTEIKVTIGEFPIESFLGTKIKAEIERTRDMFPPSGADKVATVNISGTILNSEGGLQNIYGPQPLSYDVTIYRKGKLCIWDMSNGNSVYYFGAGLFPANSRVAMLSADALTVKYEQAYDGNIAALAPEQTLVVSGQNSDVKVLVAETKVAWPELNFPHPGTLLKITRNQEPSAYFDREQIVIYSPDVGCAIPVSTDVLVNTGNRLFGDKYRLSEKALSATLAEK